MVTPGADARKKKELDDLFLKELGLPQQPAKPASTAARPATKGKVMEFRMPASSAPRPSHLASKPPTATVSIEKTFDFAGETVTFVQPSHAD